MWTWMGPRNYVLDGVQISPWERALLSGKTSEFSRMLLSTIPSGPDAGISPHAVDQHSNWPYSEVVEYHIKFSQWTPPPAMRPRQNSFTTCSFWEKQSAKFGHQSMQHAASYRQLNVCTFRAYKVFSLVKCYVTHYNDYKNFLASKNLFSNFIGHAN